MSQRGGSDSPPRYDRNTTAMEVVDGVDLRGRFILVTGGGGAGMGYEISRALASAGAHVLIGARDRARGDDAARRLREDTGNPDVEVGIVDLSSLASITGFTEDVLARGQSIDVLIDHAGIAYLPELTFTEDGFEAQFGTNYVGHVALTTGLLPALRADGGARVVVVTSGGHRYSDIHWDDVNGHRRPYDSHGPYYQSKTALCLFTVAFNRRYAPEGVFANMVCPGGVYPTSLQVHMSREDWLSYGLMDEAGTMSPLLKTPEQGAATQVWAAVSPELEGRGGLYLEHCGVGEPHRPEKDPMTGYLPHALDPVAAERLWGMTEGWLRERGYR